MGEVYRATDTRLDRVVAVKVLPAHLAQDVEKRQRFEREARAVGQLNHPHICTLHDIGRQDGIDFLVMEYLEGETLAARLAQGPLPLDQVLRCAAEIADGLAQAHRHAVFHRDLKPGNIMLIGPKRRPGTKLLDFGLAKLGLAAVEGEGSQAPTRETPLTADGAILGTFQYMAPEQLRGEESDARTDIFAFGAVVYEMVTGQRAFQAGSQAAVAAAILGQDPPPISSEPERIESSALAALDRVVKVCLAKDPEERWQSARDLLRELKWIAEGAVRTRPAAGAPAPVRRLGRREQAAWILAGTLLLATIALALGYFRRSGEPSGPVSFSVPPPEKSTFRSLPPWGGPVTVSPDGRHLASVAATKAKDLVWVRDLEALVPRPLAGTEGAIHPFWSPDSRFLGFFAGGKLKTINASGGPVHTLCDAADGRGGAWSREGVILLAPVASGPLHRVSASGGTPVPVTAPDETRGERSHRWPHFLPDGRHFLYLAGTFGPGAIPVNNHLCLGALDSKQGHRLQRVNSNGMFVPSAPRPAGHVLFTREATLMALPFDAERRRILGDALPLVEQVQHYAYAGKAHFSVSDNGVFAYQPGTAALFDLAWFDRSGKRLGTAGAPGAYGTHEISPDGRRVVFDLLDPATGSRDIWLYELSRDIRTRFTFDAAEDTNPLWSPDGRRVVFASNRKGGPDLYEKAVEGAAGEQPLLATQEIKAPGDWSRDGRFIAYNSFNLRSLADVWILPLEGERKPIPFLRTEFHESHPQFSPDGRWIAYTSNDLGRPEIYVQPFPTTGNKWQISTGGGSLPRWRSDGKELFYLAVDRKLMSVAVEAGPSFQAEAPRALFETRVPASAEVLLAFPYAVTADGQRFLIQDSGVEASVPLTVVLNWRVGPRR